MPRGSRRVRPERIGLVLAIGGIGVLAAVGILQGLLGGLAPLIGGLALDAAIVGSALMARRAAARLTRRLPPWLGW